MPPYSDQDVSALRKVAEQVDEGGQEARVGTDTLEPTVAQAAAVPAEDSWTAQPGIAPLLKRDRLRRRAWQVAAAGLLLAISIAGIYALNSDRALFTRMTRDIGNSRQAPLEASDLVITRAVTADDVGPDGRPQNVTTSFDGPTSVAVLFETEGGKPGTDVIKTSVSGLNFQRSCEPMVVVHPSATYWCQWEALDPGKYRITIELNGRVVHELSFTVVDPLESFAPGPQSSPFSNARKAPAGARNIQTSFDCLAAEPSIEKTICEDDTLARLETKLEALYRAAYGRAGEAARSRILQRQTAFESARKLKCGQAAPAEMMSCLTTMAKQRIVELDSIQLPSFPPSTAFADARRRLIALGWRPVTLATARPCPTGDASCESQLEMVVCSGGVPAACRHTWMRGRAVIEITTSSGDKSEVRSVVCRAGC